MSTKTASVRLEKKLYDKIDEHCVSEGCCRNDFIKSAIEKALDKDDDVVPQLIVTNVDDTPQPQVIRID